MDDKPAITAEIERARDRIFQLRLMLEHAKGTDSAGFAAVAARLSVEMRHLNSLVAGRKTRSRR